MAARVQGHGDPGWQHLLVALLADGVGSLQVYDILAGLFGQLEFLHYFCCIVLGALFRLRDFLFYWFVLVVADLVLPLPPFLMMLPDLLLLAERRAHTLPIEIIKTTNNSYIKFPKTLQPMINNNAPHVPEKDLLFVRHAESLLNQASHDVREKLNLPYVWELLSKHE